MDLKTGYQRTGVGVIPEDWVLSPMLATVRIANGQVDPKVEPYQSMILVAPDHVERGSGRLLKRVTARDQGAISGKYFFSKGDIVYSKIRPYLRKAVIVDFDGLCSADMYPLKPAINVSAGFVLAIILGDRFSKYAESVSVRSGMPKINRGELAEFVIAHPPTKAEQEAIAEALSDADTLIESLEQLLVKKRQIKQGTMQELLTGKRRLPGFDGGWQLKRLGEICDISMGRTPSRLNSAYWGKGYKWLSISDLKSKIVSDAKEEITALAVEDMQAIKAGTLLMSFKLSIGRLCFAGCDLYTNEAICSFNNLKAVADYLYYVLGRTDFSLYGKQAVKGHTLNKESLNAVEVPFPTMQEQTAIATILSDMDADIAALESRLAKARHIKQGMMQQLLTGKIRLI